MEGHKKSSFNSNRSTKLWDRSTLNLESDKKEGLTVGEEQYVTCADNFADAKNEVLTECCWRCKSTVILSLVNWMTAIEVSGEERASKTSVNIYRQILLNIPEDFHIQLW